jgi:hypothetical protein
MLSSLRGLRSLRVIAHVMSVISDGALLSPSRFAPV